MDTTILYFIILTVATLVIVIIGMYRQLTLANEELITATVELEDMYQCHASESNPWELADTLQAQLELSQKARKIQANQIKELQDEIGKLEYKLQDCLALGRWN